MSASAATISNGAASPPAAGSSGIGSSAGCFGRGVVSNLDDVCAHFTPRPGVLEQVRSSFAQADALRLPLATVALTGIAGCGKSEMAKRFGLEELGLKPVKEDAAADPEEEDEPASRVCWFLTAESRETLLRDYKVLCAALQIAVAKKEDGAAASASTSSEEKDNDSDGALALMVHGLGERLARCERPLLIFDNVAEFAAIKPFLPVMPTTAPASGAAPGDAAAVKPVPRSHLRVLCTSLNNALLTPNPAAGLSSVSLNLGLSEDEALQLLASTSGLPTGEEGTEERRAQAALIKELDRLPLAVSTAGLQIAAQRTPHEAPATEDGKPGEIIPPASPEYDAAAYLADLQAHSSSLLRAEQSLRGQSDYKVGQSKALQMALARLPKPMRQLLDYCTLMDSQHLPRELLVHLYRRCMAVQPPAASVVAADGAAAQAAPTVDEAALPDLLTARRHFVMTLQSPAMCSLLCIDRTPGSSSGGSEPAGSRLFMHRSTQLQLAVLAENTYGEQAEAAGAAAAPAPATGDSHDESQKSKKVDDDSEAQRPSLVRQTSRWPAPSFAPGSAELSAFLQSAPSRLHRWQAGLMRAILATIRAAYPAQEDDTKSLLRYEPAVPVLMRLTEEARALPVQHAELADLFKELLAVQKLAQCCLREHEQYEEMQTLAVSMRVLCLPGSEALQWTDLWEATALFYRDETQLAQSRLVVLLNEISALPKAEQLKRAELRVFTALNLCFVRGESNPRDNLRLAEQAFVWLDEWLGPGRPYWLYTTALVCIAIMHMHADARVKAVAVLHKALAMSDATGARDTSQRAQIHGGIALLTGTHPESLAHRRKALAITDDTHGPASTDAVEHVRRLCERMAESGDEGWIDVAQERLALLAQKRPLHGATAAAFVDFARLAQETGQRMVAVQWIRQAYETRRKIHGEDSAYCIALAAQLAARLWRFSQELSPDDADDDARKAMADEAGQWFRRARNGVPRAHARPPVLMSELRKVADAFADMGVADEAMQVGTFALEHLSPEKHGGVDRKPLMAEHCKWLGMLFAQLAGKIVLPSAENFKKQRDEGKVSPELLAELQQAKQQRTLLLEHANAMLRETVMVSEDIGALNTAAEATALRADVAALHRGEMADNEETKQRVADALEAEVKLRAKAIAMAIRASGPACKRICDMHLAAADMWATRGDWATGTQEVLMALRCYQIPSGMAENDELEGRICNCLKRLPTVSIAGFSNLPSKFFKAADKAAASAAADTPAAKEEEVAKSEAVNGSDSEGAAGASAHANSAVDDLLAPVIRALEEWDPEGPVYAHLNLGIGFILNKDVPHAEYCWQKAEEERLKLEQLSAARVAVKGAEAALPNTTRSPLARLRLFILTEARRHDEAVAAAEAWVAALDAEGVELNTAHYELALVHARRGRYDLALPPLQKAHEVHLRAFGPTAMESTAAQALLDFCKEQVRFSRARQNCLLEFDAATCELSLHFDSAEQEQRMKTFGDLFGLTAVFGAGDELDRPDAVAQGAKVPPSLSPFKLRPYSAEFPSLMYYEVTVLQSTLGGSSDQPGPDERQNFCVGFAREDHPVFLFPGLPNNSIGLAVRQGRSSWVHCGTMRGEHLPPISAGDVIGCAMDIEEGGYFFTLNGQSGGYLPLVPSGTPHACVSISALGRCVETLGLNFGDQPFVYQHERRKKKQGQAKEDEEGEEQQPERAQEDAPAQNEQQQQQPDGGAQQGAGQEVAAANAE